MSAGFCQFWRLILSIFVILVVIHSFACVEPAQAQVARQNQVNDGICPGNSGNANNNPIADRDGDGCPGNSGKGSRDDDDNDGSGNGTGNGDGDQSETSLQNQAATINQAASQAANVAATSHILQLIDAGLAGGSADGGEDEGADSSDGRSSGVGGTSPFIIVTAGQASISGKTIKSQAPSAATFSFTNPTYYFGSADSSEGFNLQGGGARTVVGKTQEQDIKALSVTTGFRYTMSNRLSGRPDQHNAVIGGFANYTYAEIDVDSDPVLKANGFDQAGEATLSSFALGAFGVLTFDRTYTFGMASGSFGNVDSNNLILESQGSYDVAGTVIALGVGHIFDASHRSKIDLRSQLSYAYGSGDSYLDSADTRYGDSESHFLTGSISAKLFGQYSHQNWKLRPFIQAGINYTFLDENEFSIEDIPFEISDNNEASAFGRLGIDFSVDKSIQSYVAVEGELGEDFDRIGGQLGISIKLN